MALWASQPDSSQPASQPAGQPASSQAAVSQQPAIQPAARSQPDSQQVSGKYAPIWLSKGTEREKRQGPRTPGAPSLSTCKETKHKQRWPRHVRYLVALLVLRWMSHRNSEKSGKQSGFGVWGLEGIFIISFEERVAQKFCRVILLHFGLVAFRVPFGIT